MQRPLSIALAGLGLLSGCAKTLPPAPIAVADLCRSWRHQTISKDDRITDATASQIEGNNAARVPWGCKKGANEAGG